MSVFIIFLALLLILAVTVLDVATVRLQAVVFLFVALGGADDLLADLGDPGVFQRLLDGQAFEDVLADQATDQTLGLRAELLEAHTILNELALADELVEHMHPKHISKIQTSLGG